MGVGVYGENYLQQVGQKPYVGFQAGLENQR